MNSRRTRKPPTVEQLRDDIDSGRTGDKVAHPDPAAAPLGADAEAGGSPPSAEELAEVRKYEGGRESGDSANAPDIQPATPDLDLQPLMADIQAVPIPGRLTEAAEKLQEALDARKK